MKEIIEKYKKYLIVNGCAYTTIMSYTQRVAHFLEQVKIEDISTETIRDYFFNLKDKFSPSTINIYKCAVSSFLNFLEKDDIIMPKYLKLDKKLPEFITLKYLENNVIPMAEVLFDKPEKTKTILYFMFYSGLRVSEVAYLKRGDFDLENKTVKIYSKKTKKERIIPYPNKIKNILETYFCLENEEKNAFNIGVGGITAIFEKLKPYFKDINLHAHLLRHCVSKDTECLTLEGWKKYDEIKIGDKIFSYNLNKNIVELTNLLNVYKYNYNGNLYNIKNRYLDSLVTKQHKNIFKVATQKQKNYIKWNKWEKWNLKTIRQLDKIKDKRLIKTLLSGKYNGKSSIGIYKAGLLGWIMTDGHISKRNQEVTISQSLSANKEKCNIIANTLKNSGVSYSAHPEKPQINHFSGKIYQMMKFRILVKTRKWIFDYLNKDNTPKLNKILQLKQNELKAIFEAMMLGDGAKWREFCDQNTKTIELIQILCLLLGYRASLQYSNLEHKYRTYITYKNHCNILHKHITQIKYKGIVWCPSTKNKTWLARRNGKVFVTGNSYATHLRKSGVKIENIQYLLGHSNIQSTMIYAHSDNKTIFDDFWKRVK